jgi:hypothetical protein
MPSTGVNSLSWLGERNKRQENGVPAGIIDERIKRGKRDWFKKYLSLVEPRERCSDEVKKCQKR